MARSCSSPPASKVIGPRPHGTGVNPHEQRKYGLYRLTDDRPDDPEATLEARTPRSRRAAATPEDMGVAKNAKVTTTKTSRKG